MMPPSPVESTAPSAFIITPPVHIRPSLNDADLGAVRLHAVDAAGDHVAVPDDVARRSRPPGLRGRCLRRSSRILPWRSLSVHHRPCAQSDLASLFVSMLASAAAVKRTDATRRPRLTAKCRETSMIDTDFFSDPSIIRELCAATSRRCAPRARSSAEHFHDTLVVTGYDEALEILVEQGGRLLQRLLGPRAAFPACRSSRRARHLAPQLDAHRGELPWSDHLVCFDGKKHAEHRMLLGSLLTYKRLKQNEDYLRGLVRQADRRLHRQGPLQRRARISPTRPRSMRSPT